ncbi:MAG: hypothetical protein AAB305_06990 [Candidatus Zixiibacteriota bacterium]
MESNSFADEPFDPVPTDGIAMLSGEKYPIAKSLGGQPDNSEVTVATTPPFFEELVNGIFPFEGARTGELILPGQL